MDILGDALRLFVPQTQTQTPRGKTQTPKHRHDARRESADGGRRNRNIGGRLASSRLGRHGNTVDELFGQHTDRVHTSRPVDQPELVAERNQIQKI